MILVYKMYAYSMKNIVDKDCGMKYMLSGYQDISPVYPRVLVVVIA